MPPSSRPAATPAPRPAHATPHESTTLSIRARAGRQPSVATAPLRTTLSAGPRALTRRKHRPRRLRRHVRAHRLASLPLPHHSVNPLRVVAIGAFQARVRRVEEDRERRAGASASTCLQPREPLGAHHSIFGVVSGFEGHLAALFVSRIPCVHFETFFAYCWRGRERAALVRRNRLPVGLHSGIGRSAGSPAPVRPPSLVRPGRESPY